MAIAFGASGSAAIGTGSLTVPHPATIASGNLLILAIANKYPNDVPSTPAGWTLPDHARHQGGRGAPAADRGLATITVFTKQADGTESGNLSVTITNGDSAVGRMFRYTKMSASWLLSACSGSEDSPGDTWDPTMASDPGIEGNDIIIACSAVNGDFSTFSSPTLTAAGATISAGIERSQDGTSLGQDCKIYVAEFSCSAGTGSLPVYTHTNGASTGDTPAGATVLLRIRELASSGGSNFIMTFCT